MTTFGGQSLMRHIHHNDLAAVTVLLQSGNINPDERDENGQTFLMAACQIGNQVIVSDLLAMDNIDVNAVDNDKWTALLNASKSNHINICKKLLDAGAFIDHRDIGGWTSLMWACYLGHTDLTQYLLEKDANCNFRGEHNMSCLTWAAGRGYVEIVKLLLEHNCKVNTVDKYGTTSLIWASRKGHLDIVKLLLAKGASVDNSGMNAWTALIAASKGGYTDVVSALLDHDPNVNIVDKDGYSALAWAAKDGHRDIVNMLLQKGTYVNTPERQGDSILILAVKGGHQDVVYALLKKHADVNIEGEDNKTALYWAVEKSHIGNVKLLLEHKANTEIANKDSDTPLLKSVRNRNIEIVELLMSKGARVSATDKKGDTSLHISVRALSKRVTEILLRDPKHGRLLYKPNKSGETPYLLDASHPKSILTEIFGARHLNAEESIQGYDLYSSTIADVLSDPTLCTPITLGLYAKWGSGKSILIRKLQKEMVQFTSHRPDTGFEFSWLQFLFCLLLSVACGLVLALTLTWLIGICVVGGVLLLQYIFLCTLWIGANKRGWSWAVDTSLYLAKKFNTTKLLLQVMFCNAPDMPDRESATVRFLFTDNARLASVVGEKSISLMISTLLEAVEQEYGTLVTRLYRVFKPGKASEKGKYKSVCCVPNIIFVVFIMLCIITTAVLISIFGIHNIYNAKYTAVDSVLIAFAIIVSLAFLGNIVMWARMLFHLVLSPERRLSRIASHMSKIKMEGFLQQLKREVEEMGHCVKCIDNFTGTSTRLVVIVDGLDSCEQDKLLQVLDTVHMLFGEESSPFITILAVDPHVVIKGIEQHIHGIFRDSSINGHDYLRNIVHLPFFLQNTSLPRNVGGSERSQSTRLDSSVSGASALTLSEPGKSKHKRKGASPSGSMANLIGTGSLIKHASTFDLNKTLMKNMYFSDINPRNMRRLMNIVAVTGRLLRAFKIDFSFYRLVSWINVTEQWPYRLSWIILESEDNEDIDATTSLKDIYDRIVDKIPASKDVDPLVEIDRNPRKLETFLTQHKLHLTLADLKKFLFCTINVDPYLRKLIRELQQANEPVPLEQSHLYPCADGSVITSSWPNSRRPQSRLDTASPRLTTPTRGPSRVGYNHFNFPSTAPAYSITPTPHSICPHSVCPQTTPGTTKTTSKQKLRMEGGSPTQTLTDMSVEDICSYTSRLETISQQKMMMYHERFRDLNLSGIVLSTCDVAELKAECCMSFGDWELFKSMILALRERETQEDDTTVQEKLSRIPSDTQPDTAEFSQELSNSDTPLSQPQAQYVRRTSSSFGDSHGPLIPQNDASPSKKWNPSGHRVNADGGKYKRKDSFVGEIIFEHQAIKTVMNNMGMPDSSEEDDVEEEITTPSTDVFGSSVTSISSRIPDDVIITIPEEDAKKQPTTAQQPHFTLYDSDHSLSASQTTDTYVQSESKSTVTTSSGTYITHDISGSSCSIDDTLIPLNDSHDDNVPLMSPEILQRPPSGGESIGPSAFTMVSPLSSAASSRAASRASVKATSSYAGSVKSYSGSTDSVRTPRRDSVTSRKSMPGLGRSSRPVSVTSEASTTGPCASETSAPAETPLIMPSTSTDERDVVVREDGSTVLLTKNSELPNV